MRILVTVIVLFLLVGCGDKHYHSTTPLGKDAGSTQNSESKRVLESDRSGSGGEGWVCRDKKDNSKIVSVKLLDFVEGEVIEGIVPNLKVAGKSNPSYIEILEELISRVKTFDRDYMSEHLDLFFGLIKKFPVKEGKNPLIKIAPFKIRGESGTFSLAEVGDSNKKFIPNSSNCGFEQIARQNKTPQIYNTPIIIHPDYVPHMSEGDFAGLIFHELILMKANDFKHPNSDNTRYFTSIIGSDLLREKKESSYLRVLASAGFIAFDRPMSATMGAMHTLSPKAWVSMFLNSGKDELKNYIEENKEEIEEDLETELENINFFSLDPKDVLEYGKDTWSNASVVLKGRPYNRFNYVSGRKITPSKEGVGSYIDEEIYSTTTSVPENSIELLDTNVPRYINESYSDEGMPESPEFTVLLHKKNYLVKHSTIHVPYSVYLTNRGAASFLYTINFESGKKEIVKNFTTDSHGRKKLKKDNYSNVLMPDYGYQEEKSSFYEKSEYIYDGNDNPSPEFLWPVENVKVQTGDQAFTFIKDSPLFLIDWEIAAGTLEDKTFIAFVERAELPPEEESESSEDVSKIKFSHLEKSYSSLKILSAKDSEKFYEIGESYYNFDTSEERKSYSIEVLKTAGEENYVQSFVKAKITIDSKGLCGTVAFKRYYDEEDDSYPHLVGFTPCYREE